MITGSQVYPPAILYGIWRSGENRMAFQRPPASAVATLSADGREEAFDIVRAEEQPGDTILLILVPRGLDGPRLERRFRIDRPGDRLIEPGSTTNRVWIREP